MFKLISTFKYNSYHNTKKKKNTVKAFTGEIKTIAIKQHLSESENKNHKSSISKK